MTWERITAVAAANSPLSGALAGICLTLGLGLATLGRQLALRFLRRHRMGRGHLAGLASDVIDRTFVLLPLALGVGAANVFVTLPVSWATTLRRAVGLVVILQAARWGDTLVDHGLTAWFDRQGDKTLAAHRSGRGMLRFGGALAVWSLALMVALKSLGYDVSGLAAGLGVAGVAITLATQSLLGDLFASLSILLDKPFLVGDVITVGQVTGEVERIGVRTTRLRSLGGEEVVLPNSDLAKSRVHNFRSLSERRVVFSFSVRYQTDPALLRQVRGIVEGAVLACGKARFDRAELLSFGELGFGFEVVYFVLGAEYALYTRVQQDINLAIIDAFAAAGIGFAQAGVVLAGPAPLVAATGGRAAG